jgi:hypothetical protein
VSLSLRLLLFSATCLASVTFAQAPPPRRNLVSHAPNASDRVRLQKHVLAGQDELAPLSAVTPTSTLRLTFILSRPPESQAAFQNLLADQQNPTSPRYHHWLTPSQIGEQYGPTGHDLSALTDWLVSQGLSVREVAPSGIFIQVEGSAASISKALDTDLHYIDRSTTPGIAPRIAATRDPAIPSAFGALVESIAGLSGEEAHPLHDVKGIPITDLSKRIAPLANAAPASHYITPNDFARIYSVDAVYNSGIDGTGQSVAIIGRSRVLAADITNFATFASRPARLPNVIVPSSGTDPGLTGDGDQAEATLDVDRVLGTAPGAHVDLVISASQSGGIQTAAQFEVQTLIDPIMSVSFGACEAAAGLPFVRFWDALFTQAAAEGISTFVASGDAGAAGCGNPNSTPVSNQSRGINSLCASTNVTCVGGTEFADFADPAAYWGSTEGAGRESATGYIPEGAWNEPSQTSPTGLTTYVAAATGGGSSTYIGKPSWQIGPGVPGDNFRDVPDVSFSSSLHDGYLTCLAYAGFDCSSQIAVFSGTSAAAPSMAGIAALLNQRLGAAQGNLNPLLYQIASSALPQNSATNAFHDVTPQTSGVALCDIGTPSMCNNSTPAPGGLSGGLAGYPLTTGYDLATGLGSVNVIGLLTAATTPIPQGQAPVSISISSNPGSINTPQTTQFFASLGPAAAGTITGTVQFFSNGGAVGSPVPVSSQEAVSDPLSFPAVGTYTINAVYSGNGNYATATSSPISLIVTAAPTATTTVTLSLASPTVALGGSDAFTVTVAATSSSAKTPSGYVQFYQGSKRLFGPIPLTAGALTTYAVSAGATVGTSSITAAYLGDANFLGSTSTAQPLTVTRGPTTTQVNPAYGSVSTGVADPYVASIGFVSFGVPSPTGSVEFFQGSASLGKVAVINAQATLLAAPQSSAGTYGISAVYSGDAYYLGSSSIASSVTVSSDPPYQISASALTLSVTAGATTQNGVNILLTQSNNFIGNVNLTCKVAYQGIGTVNAAPTCTFASNFIPFPAGNANSLLIVSTTAHGSNSAANKLKIPGRHAPLLALCSVLLFVLAPRPRSISRLSPLLLAVFVVCLAGCGGGTASTGGGTTPPPPAATGTTPGDYLITISSTNTGGVPNPAPISIKLTVK